MPRPQTDDAREGGQSGHQSNSRIINPSIVDADWIARKPLKNLHAGYRRPSLGCTAAAGLGVVFEIVPSRQGGGGRLKRRLIARGASRRTMVASACAGEVHGHEGDAATASGLRLAGTRHKELEQWAELSRNAGRHHSGMVGDIDRNPHDT